MAAADLEKGDSDSYASDEPAEASSAARRRLTLVGLAAPATRVEEILDESVRSFYFRTVAAIIGRHHRNEREISLRLIFMGLLACLVMGVQFVALNAVFVMQQTLFRRADFQRRIAATSRLRRGYSLETSRTPQVRRVWLERFRTRLARREGVSRGSSAS